MIRIHQFTTAGVFLNDNGVNVTVNQNEIDGTTKVGGGGLFHLDQDNFDGFWFTNNCVVNGTMGTGFFVDGTRNVDKSSFTAEVEDNAEPGKHIDKFRITYGSPAVTEGDTIRSGNIQIHE